MEKSESGGGTVINFATRKETVARELLAAGFDTSHIVNVRPAQWRCRVPARQVHHDFALQNW